MPESPPHSLTREYSQRLGTLTAEQLQAALDRFDLGKLLDAKSAPGGLFGQNVLLTTSKGGYVLRGAPHYDGQFAKERYFSRIVHERTLANAPWPFFIERTPDLFGWSYALMPLLPGVHLSDGDVQRDLKDDDRPSLARAMGEHLALMQQATWEEPGEYDYALDDVVPLHEPFAAWFISGVRDRLAKCLEDSDATTDDDLRWVESVIERASDALTVPFTPALVHTDYAEGNVVAERTGDGWRITGVFDLGEAYAGDGEYDLARLGCWYARMSPDVLRAFIDGYAAQRPLREQFADRIALYVLADRLIFWEYGQRNKIWFKPGVTLRAFAGPFVRTQLL